MTNESVVKNDVAISAVTPEVVAASATPPKKKKKENWLLYLFVLPAFLIHFCVVAIPALSSFRMSLYDWNLLGSMEYVGLDNFIKIFTDDPQVFPAIMNNLKWLAFFITVPIIMGFTIAILVSSIKRFQLVLRTVYFLPYVVAAVVAGKIWTALMNPYYGLNAILGMLGFESLAEIKWLGNPDIALFSVAFVDNWHWWGFIMVLFLGALQQVDPSLYDAAKVDGATKIGEIIHVAIPGIRHTIAFVFIMTVMWSFLAFDYVWVMTNGGPAGSTEILSILIYKNAFVKYNAGYASALTIMQCGICIVLHFINQYVSKKGGLNDD